MWYWMEPSACPTARPPQPCSPPLQDSETEKRRGLWTENIMSDSLVVCEVDPELKEKLRKFRFRKETDNAAIIMKVDKDRQMVVLEEELQVVTCCLLSYVYFWPQNISPEELKLELPERQPRFVVYSYKYVHEDGRVSYPLCFIFSSPAASPNSR
ncbi:glia maturation factor gamma isoform X5 [Heterocephalus glaber]|uniref:Glia maturation factor gamma isoform X5 n=1 Tax=Heterocephalus glaber TaxID=10181 RepID=A0AAX6RFC3_HETGA|nr:glia maturation factor gamma isoform X5 [Heterocephalus glaber]